MADLQERRKFWIDTDAGLDDAQAILMALAQPDVDVIGISCCHGNASVEQVARNVLRLLKVADRLDIPVYVGSSVSLLGGREDSSFYHGKDGFGDVPDPSAPGLEFAHSEHAVSALSRTTLQYKGEVSLICLGPLTNIALTLRLHPDFGSTLKDAFIMGGNYEGRGNITACAEFNFYADPEAAHVALKELGCNITIACWELCLKHSLSWEVHRDLRSPDTVKSNFMRTLQRGAVRTSHELQWPRYQAADELLMAAALQPHCVLDSITCYASVELGGHHTRGMMFLDLEGIYKKPPNISVVKELDEVKYLTCLKQSIQ